MHREGAHVVEMPYLRPRDTLACLLKGDPWLLLGGMNPGPDTNVMLQTFWGAYKLSHPSHQVFVMAEQNQVDLSWTIPVMLHGDGARTVKKQPLEVVSLVSVLGLDTAKDLTCTCPNKFCYSKDASIRDPMLLKLNNSYNSHLHHFLIFCFPSKKYKGTPGLLKAMLRKVSEEIAECCVEGVSVPGYPKPWHIAVIGLRGDAEWHSKTGVLNRSYQNVGHKNEIPCCHLCLAGSPNIPFESFRSDAAWKHTLGHSAPWHALPPYEPIPFEADWTCGAAANFFRYDPFHVFRLGIARNFVASSIIMFCNFGYYDSPGDDASVVGRLERAWASFSLWCEAHGKHPASIRSFSKEKMHYATTSSFPFVGCKGSDTVLLLSYLKFFSGLQIANGNASEEVRLVKQACEHGLNFGGIHRHGLFLVPMCRDYLYQCVKGFCHAYSRLASQAFNHQMTLFGLVPKAHALAHIYFDLERAWRDTYAINPGVFDTSASEDFVGRIGRMSRRVSYRHVIRNTLLSYKIKTKFVISRFKKAKHMGL